jgi:hypothetical protein
MRAAHSTADPQHSSAVKGVAFARRFLIPAGLALLIIGWFARGVLWQLVEGFMLNVLPIVFTPVILELSVGFVGLFIVLMFCHLRRKDQEDEWVYIAQVEPEVEMEAIPEPLRKRVSETVLKSQDLIAGDDVLALEAVEGLIDLGLLEDAEKEMVKVASEARLRPAYIRLNLELLLRRERWLDAESYVAPPPMSPDGLAICCVKVARHFVMQKPSQKEAARQCLELGKKLSVGAVVNAIDADGRLQKLA